MYLIWRYALLYMNDPTSFTDDLDASLELKAADRFRTEGVLLARNDRCVARGVMTASRCYVALIMQINAVDRVMLIPVSQNTLVLIAAGVLTVSAVLAVADVGWISQAPDTGEGFVSLPDGAAFDASQSVANDMMRCRAEVSNASASHGLTVNFFGGPGIGKTDISLGVFRSLKRLGVHVEFGVEFAKGLVFEGRSAALQCQSYVLGNQIWLIERGYAGGAHVMVTDSPALLSCCYQTSPAIEGLAVEYHNSRPSLNYTMTRKVAFQAFGRLGGEADAIATDQRIISLLEAHDVPHTRLDGGNFDVLRVILDVVSVLPDPIAARIDVSNF